MKRVFRPVILACLALSIGCAGVDPNDISQWSAEKLYAEFRSELGKENWDTALEYLDELESRFPYGQYAPQVVLERAYIFYKRRKLEEARAEIDRFIRIYPSNPGLDYAYYLRGLTAFNEDRSIFGVLAGNTDLTDRDPELSRQAFDSFNEVVTRFPDSVYAKDAALRMQYLLNAVALHDVRIAQFYLDRNAWVAAVNRAKHVLENYPKTPAVEDALGIMIQAYQNMGLDDLARDSARVLRNNYPQSRYLGEI